jgi:hypothetical protein
VLAKLLQVLNVWLDFIDKGNISIAMPPLTFLEETAGVEERRLALARLSLIMYLSSSETRDAAA